MAQTEGSMVGYAMRGGLYLGLSMIVCLVIYALVPFLSLFALVGIVIAYWKVITYFDKLYTDEVREGVFSFGRTFGMGAYISVYGAMLVALATYLFFSFIAPGYFSAMVSASADLMEQMAQSEEHHQMAAEMRKVTPLDMTYSSLWSVVLFGLFISFLIAINRKVFKK